RVGVGDFDGDGRADLFLATGTAFYYSPGGEAEWRLLAAGRTDRIASVLFGDFDGDGRTDVIGKNGANINVSWGGVGEWERLNTVPAPITDLAVGNFDGIGSDDIVRATGRTWYLSAGGSGRFDIVNTSSFRVRDLRFGDFNANGKTDVFGVVSGNWMFSDGATTAWTPLRTPRLTDTVDDLFIGDFNGDGRDDVGHFDNGFFSNTYEYWAAPAVLPGTGGFTTLVDTRRDRTAAGRFLGGAQSQLLFWDDAKLDIVYVGSGGFANYSRQDMK
ncbi:MAG: VCBS repeat-containing protein, partial [Acidobacteriota bacterium]